MQDTQYALKLADLDKSWMLYPGPAGSADADLKRVIPALSDSLAGPSSLDAAPEPLSGLSLALANASLEINSLTLEQVRLRESLEALTSTLFITGDALALKPVDAAASESKAEQKGRDPAADSFLEKGVKEVRDSLWETLKTRFSGNVVDAVADLAPESIGKWFKEDKKAKDCCCPSESENLRGRNRSVSKTPYGLKRPGGSKLPKSRSKPGPGRKTGGFNATIRSLFEMASKPLGASRRGFQAGAPAQGASPRPSLPANRKGRSAARAVTPALNLPKAPATGLIATMAKLESAGARSLAPLRVADAAVNVIQGVRNGDLQAVGTGLGTAGGAWAGASAGAALGTLVFPGVGTAVGGAIGGLLGGEAGSWLSEKLFGSDDRLPSPNAVSKELNNARTDNVQVTIAPSIQITGVNPADAQQVVERVIQVLQSQCMPMVNDALGIRYNAALADLGGD
jgi:hypothetical protein